MGADTGGRRPERAFAHALETFKREGSNVLLVGDAEAHTRACRRLLGDPDDDTRYHLLATTTPPDRSITAGRPDGERTEHVAFREDERECPESARSATTLDDLGTKLVKAIDGLEATAGGLDPGELRVCVDSLEPLLEGHPSEVVFRLLHVVTARTRLVDGIGHYHLHRDRTHETVHLLEPLFDAVVEVRLREGVTEGRWHLRDRHSSSDWVSF